MGINNCIDEHEKLALLAAQYDEQGKVVQAARFYRLAGEQAAAQYVNDKAVAYLNQALIRTAESQIGERFALLLAREKVYALQGNQEPWKRDLTSLEFLATQLRKDKYRAVVTARQANHYLLTGQHETAVTMAQTAVRLAQIAKSPQDEVFAYIIWGQALIRQGSYDWAETQLSQALPLAQETGNPQLEADCVRAIGLLYQNKGDLMQSRVCYQKAQAIYEEINDSVGQSYTLNNLGHIAYNRKHYSAAKDNWEKALTAHQTIGDRSGQAMVLSNLGAMHMDVGDYNQAQTYNEDALTISREYGSLMGQSMAYINLALLNHYQERQEDSLNHSQQALELNKQMKSPMIQGYALIAEWYALLALNKPVEAQESCWQSLTIWHEINQINLEFEQRAGLAKAYLAQGKKEEALAEVNKILIHLELDDPLEGVESPFRVYLSCYQVLVACEDPRAQTILETGHTRLQEKAAELAEESVRQAYLNNVLAHRQIVTAYTENKSKKITMLN